MNGGLAGGSDTCLYYLIKQLDRSKYEPILLYKYDGTLLRELESMGIKIIPIPKVLKARLHAKLLAISKESNTQIKSRNLKTKLIKKSGSVGLFFGTLKHTLKTIPEIIQCANIIINNRIDIVHTNHYLTGDRPMLIAAILTRRKVISHNRGLYEPDFIDRFLSKFIDQIVSMSDFSTSVYVKGGVQEAKCITIYDGIDLEKFEPQNVQSEKVIIGCIGRIEKWKGQQVLVEAAEIIVKIIPDIKFLFVGEGDNEKEIKVQIQSKGLEKYFDFTGHVTNVKDHMKKSTIIVHTSIEPEPFGMVIIEAMALEKPVIATNIGGPLEIIDNENDGLLIPPNNPNVLAESIILLTKDYNLRIRIGKKGREKVIEKFDSSKYAKQIELVYEKLTK